MRKTALIDLEYGILRLREKGQTNWAYITLMTPADDSEGHHPPAMSATSAISPEKAREIAAALLDFAGSPPAHTSVSLPYDQLEIAFAEAVIERERLKAEVKELRGQVSVLLEIARRESEERTAPAHTDNEEKSNAG